MLLDLPLMNIALSYPDPHLVDVGDNEQNLLPLEVWAILPDQPFRGDLVDRRVADMIEAATTPPDVA